MASCGCNITNPKILLETDYVLHPEVMSIIQAKCPNKDINGMDEAAKRSILSSFTQRFTAHTAMGGTQAEHNALLNEYYTAICNAAKIPYPNSNYMSLYPSGESNYTPWLVGAGILAAGIYFIKKRNKKGRRRK